jgi:hypothetical protein
MAELPGGMRVDGSVYEHWYVLLPPLVLSSLMAADEKKRSNTCHFKST